jgi:hypothetical protein
MRRPRHKCRYCVFHRTPVFCATDARPALPFVPSPEYDFDVFCGHAWGPDGLGRDNRRRVMEIAERLRARGIRVWIDECERTGDVMREIAENIDRSHVYLAFVTRSYMDKVRGDASTSCGHEFSYAYLRKGKTMILPVVMEPHFYAPAAWQGPLGYLAPLFNCSLAEDPITDAHIDQLVAALSRTFTRAHALASLDTAATVPVRALSALEPQSLAESESAYDNQPVSRAISAPAYEYVLRMHPNMLLNVSLSRTS